MEDDLINMKYVKSNRYPHMSNIERAHQFAPFAALTGLDDDMKEVSRLTNKKHGLTDEDIRIINEQLLLISDCIKDLPLIKINYFVPDKYKKGGSNQEIINNVKKIDLVNHQLKFVDNQTIKIKDITHIEFM